MAQESGPRSTVTGITGGTTVTGSTTVTGIALILAPLLALGLKFFSFGWMMVILLMGPVVLLLAGYAVQIVIAAQGFLSRRALFRSVDASPRPIVAAWLTSVGVLLLGIFMPDGGDVGHGSTLQVWLGSYGPNGDAVHAATDGLTAVVALVGLIAWFGGYLWLVLEWVLALIRRSHARRASAY